MCACRWSQISQHLPGRTDNEIKNHWHSYLKKRVSKQDIISSTTKADQENTSSGGGGGSMGNLLESSYSPNSPSLIPKSSTTQNSAVFLESLEQHLDQGSSSTDTEPSVSLQQMDYFPADHHHHHQAHVSLMPKILFAEWLSMDTFRDQLQNAPIINYVGKHNFDYYNNNSDFQDAFMLINHGDDDQQLFFQEGNFGSSHVDINHRGGGGEGGSGQLISSNDIVTVDNNNNNNNMIQTTPKFEVDHFSENGFVDFISGQFNITSDEMYL